jgi:hypothetical protein
MTYDQHAHRREAYGVRGSSTSRRHSLCEGSMSRGEGTRLASHRVITPGTAAPTAVNGPELGSRARDEARPAGERLLKRAAFYARVSTEKQEREATIASQVGPPSAIGEKCTFHWITGSVASFHLKWF